jgi:hypothetical protein
MDRLLSDREKVNAELKEAIDEPTEQPGHRLGRLAVGPVELATARILNGSPRNQLRPSSTSCQLAAGARRT